MCTNNYLDESNQSIRKETEPWINEYFQPILSEVPYFKSFLLSLRENGIMSQKQICETLSIAEEELEMLHNEYCLEHIICTTRLGSQVYYRLTDFCMHLFEKCEHGE